MKELYARVEGLFDGVPLGALEGWGRTAFVLGLVLAVAAFGGFTFRPGGRWGLGRERQSWDARAILSTVITFVLVVVSGWIGSFFILVPGAQTFESLKDLFVFLCVVLFGYPALITVPFAYALSDLIEGVPPDFLLDWLPGYFINPACFWIACQLFGKNPDFRRPRTWAAYLAFVAIFLALEPALWGHICAGKFTPEIAYRRVSTSLVFTTGITWTIAPFAMLVALPAARRLGLFWAEIPGHVRERRLGGMEWAWVAGGDRPPAVREWPLRFAVLAPFLALILVLVGATAYVSLHSAERDARLLASRLHQEISDGITARVAEGPPDGLAAFLRSRPVAERGFALIVDRGGRVVASSAAADDPVVALALRTPPTGTVEYEIDHVTAKPLARATWMIRATPCRDPNPDWFVLTGMPRAYVYAGLLTGSSRSALVVAAALIAALALGSVLASRVSAPLRDVAAAASAISGGDLTVRVPESRIEELGDVARSFNDMTGRLRTSIDILKAEISARSRAEKVMESEARVLSRIINDRPLSEILDAIATEIGESSPGTLASILLMDPDGLRMRHGAGPNLPEAYRKAVDGSPIGPTAGSCGTAAWRREPVVVADIETDPLWKDYRDLARRSGLRACWSTPIFGSGQELLGTFALYYREIRHPGPSDLERVSRAAYLAGLAIERVRGAESLRVQERRLIQEKRFIDTLMDSLPGVVLLFDGDGRIRKWNRAVEGVSGRAPREIDGAALGDLVAAPDLERVREMLRQAMAGERAVAEAGLRSRDGTAVPYYLKATRLATEDGVHALAVGIDLTERRKLEEQMRQSQKMEAIGHLAAGVAHDFNNLLTVVSGHCQILESTALPEGDAREAVSAIRDAGERAAALTRQLLSFSRGGVQQPKVLDLNVEVRETEKLLRRMIGEDIRLETDLAEGLPPIKTDPGQLGQVLLNLAVNARDAMPKGGRLTLATRRSVIDGRVFAVLSVTDTGCGMPPEVRARVFEPFFTTKAVGKGTGLGLATVYGIVRQGGGHVDVRSEVGRGSSFDVHFPASSEPLSSRQARPPAVAGHRGAETILLVEDDAAVRTLSRRVLQAQGYRMLVGVDGNDALREADGHAGPIHLMVTDVIMPGLSGRELSDALRRRNPSLRVLYVSGYTDDAVLRRGVETEGVDFLPKPFTPADLARKVREVLDGA